MNQPAILELITLLHDEELIRLIRRAEKKDRQKLAEFLHASLKERKHGAKH